MITHHCLQIPPRFDVVQLRFRRGFDCGKFTCQIGFARFNNRFQNFRGLFQAINKGNTFLNVNAYNGGLFFSDKVLDKLIVADELCEGFLKLAEYDFDSKISVTVLGHIFEQSISDLEEITAQIQIVIGYCHSKRI